MINLTPTPSQKNQYYKVINDHPTVPEQEHILFIKKITLSVAIWTCALVVFPQVSVGMQLEESGCIAGANQWIQQLNQTAKRDILIRNTQSDCEHSAKWIKKTVTNNNEKSWKRMCNDLVLIWTHKKCIYYRDYLNYSAYTPCKEWTRQMYRHCVSRDLSWFYE